MTSPESSWARPGRTHHDRRAGARRRRQRRDGRAHARRSTAVTAAPVARRLRARATPRRAHPSPRRGGPRRRRRAERGRGDRPRGNRSARVDRPRDRERVPPSARRRALHRQRTRRGRPRPPARARSATPTATRSPRRYSLRVGSPCATPSCPTTIDATRAAFERAAAEIDYIVTSGGVSVGDFDFVKPVLEELGELEFWKVKMRPGNPQTLGSIGGVPFFGLPGNPTSTIRRLRDVRAPVAADDAGIHRAGPSASRWHGSRMT